MSISVDDAQDLAWVRLVQSHDDRAAFAHLVRRHQGRVRAVLGRLTGGHQALADELAQDTFLRAYHALAEFRGESRFRTWLYRIAYNVFLQHYRRGSQRLEARRQSIDDDDAAVHASDGGAQSAGLELNLDLHHALDQLSDDEREAIIHCYFADLSHNEAAEVLGWPLGTIKTHVLRAKAKLKISLHAWSPSLATEDIV